MILQGGEISKYSCVQFYLQPHYESLKILCNYIGPQKVSNKIILC